MVSAGGHGSEWDAEDRPGPFRADGRPSHADLRNPPLDVGGRALARDRSNRPSIVTVHRFDSLSFGSRHTLSPCTY